jgi:hypothetical protein
MAAFLAFGAFLLKEFGTGTAYVEFPTSQTA